MTYRKFSELREATAVLKERLDARVGPAAHTDVETEDGAWAYVRMMAAHECGFAYQDTRAWPSPDCRGNRVHARANPDRYTKEFRAHLLSGAGMCARCQALDVLDARPVPAGSGARGEDVWALLARLAPEEPYNEDEQGGCVWCGGPWNRKYKYAGEDPADHAADCPWVAARALLASLGGDGGAAPTSYRLNLPPDARYPSEDAGFLDTMAELARAVATSVGDRHNGYGDPTANSIATWLESVAARARAATSPTPPETPPERLARVQG